MPVRINHAFGCTIMLYSTKIDILFTATSGKRLENTNVLNIINMVFNMNMPCIFINKLT